MPNHESRATATPLVIEFLPFDAPPAASGALLVTYCVEVPAAPQPHEHG
ncbi:hypothetical protein [Actinomycetospora sp. NBRC 106378]|jgi:hypothetical protein|nr:hypothetical protein [Actinomycetospora sp. NBRC 106378]GLZ55397.1 hypothetical protein Acsp07_50140 [Actinomycetospora sp. NBRC 106378]